jgi:hypothetical protein
MTNNYANEFKINLREKQNVLFDNIRKKTKFITVVDLFHSFHRGAFNIFPIKVKISKEVERSKASTASLLLL